MKALIHIRKEIEETQKDCPCSWIGSINIVKITTLPKATYGFSSQNCNIVQQIVLVKWMATCSRMKIHLYLSLYGKLNSKWINIRPHTLNLIEKKVGSRLKLPGTGKNFLKRFLKVQALRPATNNVRSHEAKMLLYSKGHHHLSKGQPIKWEKVFTNYTSDWE